MNNYELQSAIDLESAISLLLTAHLRPLRLLQKLGIRRAFPSLYCGAFHSSNRTILPSRAPSLPPFVARGLGQTSTPHLGETF